MDTLKELLKEIKGLVGDIIKNLKDRTSKSLYRLDTNGTETRGYSGNNALEDSATRTISSNLMPKRIL